MFFYLRNGRNVVGLNQTEQNFVQRNKKDHFLERSDNDFILMIKKSGETRRVVFEEEVADSLIKIHHRSTVGGHSGIVSTYNKLKSSYFWKEMKSDVAEFVSIALPRFVE